MFDPRFELKDAGLVAVSGAGTVDGLPKVLNLGRELVEGKLVIDVNSLEIDANELYRIKLQGSASHDFSSKVEDLAILELGAKEVLGGDQDSEPGRYVLAVSNAKGLTSGLTSGSTRTFPGQWPRALTLPLTLRGKSAPGLPWP